MGRLKLLRASALKARLCFKSLCLPSTRVGGILAFSYLAFVPAIALQCATSTVVHSQDLAKTFGGFSSDPDAPIDIEANRLDVDDKAKTATFTGNVRAAQGEFTLRSKVLVVNYSGGQSGTEGATEVTNIKATGKVLITSDKEQTATSEWADFDVKSQVIKLGGDVILTQGPNVIRGETLIVDLNTGRSSFEAAQESLQNKQKRGRIKMLITKPPKKVGKPTGTGSSASQVLRRPTSVQ